MNEWMEQVRGLAQIIDDHFGGLIIAINGSLLPGHWTTQLETYISQPHLATWGDHVNELSPVGCE